MKKIILILSLIISINLYSLEVEHILQEFSDSIMIPNLSGEFTVTLISKNGDKRVIKADGYQKMVDTTQMNRLFKFNYPPSVRDTGLLIHSFYGDTAANKMWLYLPIVKKIKRISLSSAGGGYFMGSDFSYADLISKSSSNNIQQLDGEAVIENIECIKIKEYGKSVKDRENLGYSHIINYYGKEDSFLYGRDYYELSGDLLKTYRVKDITKLKNYIYPNLVEMKNVQTDHLSIISVDNIEIDEISDSYFTTRYLKK